MKEANNVDEALSALSTFDSINPGNKQIVLDMSTNDVTLLLDRLVSTLFISCDSCYMFILYFIIVLGWL